MGAASEVRIEHVILHILDPKKPDPVLSQRPLPETTDPRVFDYFKKHITNSQGDPRIREARFQDLESPVARTCRGILQETTPLVDGSQELARSLHRIVKANQSISRGDLAVCVYQDETDGTAERRLALLKIDPVEGFRQSFKGDYVAIEIDTDLLPSTSQELQKCAFIRWRAPESPEPDMALLDLQGKEEKVALFFTRTFLGAELLPDPREMARQVARVVIDLENDLRPLGEWEPVAGEVWSALATGTVHFTRQWVGGLGVSAEAKRTVEARLGGGQVLDRRLTLDRDQLAKVIEKVRFQGDYGLKIEVLGDHFDDVVKSIKWKTRKAGADYFEIVLHTSKLKRV